MQGIDIIKIGEDSWRAIHVASDRSCEASSKERALASLCDELGIGEDLQVANTSDLFEGDAKRIAEFLENTVSGRLALHSGYARLEAYADTVATVRLGGACQGCPSSRVTLMEGVLLQLQEEFGEELVLDVQPAID